MFCGGNYNFDPLLRLGVHSGRGFLLPQRFPLLKKQTNISVRSLGPPPPQKKKENRKKKRKIIIIEKKNGVSIVA